MLNESAPFILFDDARANAGRARLYQRPLDIIETHIPDEVPAALMSLAKARQRGLHAAGFLAYEAGYVLEPRLAPFAAVPEAAAPPLLWFALFEGYENIAADEVPALLPNPAGAWAGAPEPLMDKAEYDSAVLRLKARIEAGDIYQANFTFPAKVRVAGHPLALYAALRSRACVGHGGVVFTGAHWLLSFSPELFFTLENGHITARPMKGTLQRTCTGTEIDEAMVQALKGDPKQRAENLMIVDLIRNDLSRVSKPGSVKVPALYAVETYPSVHQMTSTVVAALQDDLDAIDVIKAIFPCGSVTGAPKIRAMEIIEGEEKTSRGPYTGSMGWLEPAGDAAFNVAIRTLVLPSNGKSARLGLGSAIVADSEVGEEWRECLAKGAFVAAGACDFDLFETMYFDPDEGIRELERHLTRLGSSARCLDFSFDWHGVRNDLQAVAFQLHAPAMIRLKIARSGAIAIETRRLPKQPAEPVEVALAPLPVAHDDFRLRHKTSNRAFYDDARLAAGRFETIFCDSNGFVTEGSFTSIFVERHGVLLTPPLSRGLLPGILRTKLIEEGRAEEADLTAGDLAGGFYLGNSVRGLMRAMLVT